jgi:hypothetical protein
MCTVIEINDDIKMQRRKIGADFNDEIGITYHRIGLKFVGFDDSVIDGDFNCFVRCNLDSEILFLPQSFIFIRKYLGENEQTVKRSPPNARITSSFELMAWIASKFFS